MFEVIGLIIHSFFYMHVLCRQARVVTCASRYVSCFLLKRSGFTSPVASLCLCQLCFHLLLLLLLSCV